MYQMLGIFILSDLCLLVYGIYLYNRLVRQQNLVDEAWSGVSVQLKKRHNLIPNLVETVKGYGSHEIETLSKTIRERSNPDLVGEDKSALEVELGRDTKKLFALAEAYPDLKASSNFVSLQKNLVQIEDDLQYARRYYNGTVRNFNISTETFPSNLLANFMRFKSKDFFEIEYATERKNPDVEF